MKDIRMEDFIKLNPHEIQLIDVREKEEFEASHIDGARNIPKGELISRINELGIKHPIYVICKTGARSQFMGQVLEQHSFDVINVLGGNDAYLQLTSGIGNL